MPQNFITCDREQELLLPPSLREWLPEDHLAWFVMDAVEQIDLSAVYDSYRADDWGRCCPSLRAMPNVFDLQWDEQQDRPPLSWKRARLGRQAGGRALGASLFELPPGLSRR